MVVTRLEQVRRRRGWTQTQLAARARLHQGDISELERGRVRLGPKRMARLAKVLGIPAEELLVEIAR
jgi:transcriptional regulator with XRE-family HTH domain